ncbi:glycosyltransferase [Cytobacillus sp. NJ13]|nr:glycosyltransferase [Cytobacillus sp. NJ13]
MQSSLFTNTAKKAKGVSIITCTNKPIYMNNIFENYWNQTWSEKELIIILNRDDMDLAQWRRKANGDPNIFIYQLPKNLSLGQCLNFAIDQTQCDFIAIFDDDDYYAPLYLNNMMLAFDYTDADIIGKKTHYVYFESCKALYLRNLNQENQFVNWVCGGKKIVKRNVFDKVRFRNISNNEDVKFCKDCVKHGFKIYSTDRYHLVYVRRANPEYHTWKINDKKLIKSCKFITYTDDYKDFCMPRINKKE